MKLWLQKYSAYPLIATIIIMALYSVNMHKAYESTTETLQTSRRSATVLYEQEIDKLSDELANVTNLLHESNKNLKLLYTFAKTGIKAETIEEVRELLALAANLPIGSPFNEDFIITSPFGARDERAWSGDGNHIGLDLIPKSGRAKPTIYLTADGTITEFGVSNVYGKYIVVETKSGYKMVYGHLSKIFYQDDEGRVSNIPLKKGAKLGVMGETGIAIGAHLHFELWVFDVEQDKYLLLDPKEVLRFVK